MLLTPTDLQSALNIDLTSPNGQDLANALIAAAQALFSGPAYLGFPIEQAQVSEYRRGGVSQVWLDTTAPVSDLAVAQRDSASTSYDTVDAANILNHGERSVLLLTSTSDAPHALRFTYTTGWTGYSLPRDLRQAIIDTVGIKLQEVANFSSTAPGVSSGEDGEEMSASPGALKKTVSLGYTEEFSTVEADVYWKAKTSQLTRTIGDNLPTSITDIVLAYRPAIAL